MNISLLEPSICRNDISSVESCLKSGWVSTAGPYQFEAAEKLKEICKSKYVLLTQSGTSALQLALLSLKLNRGAGVIIPTVSFGATAHAVVNSSLIPVFVGIDETRFSIDPQKLEEFIKKKCRWNPTSKQWVMKGEQIPIRAVIVVHLRGYPALIKEILEVCRRYQLKLIEDSAQALGSKIRRRHLGTLGDIGILSFNGNKIVTAGAGGAVLTRSAKYYERAFTLANQGKKKGKKYDFIVAGYNFLMPSLNASLLKSQLDKLTNFIKMKRQVFMRYEKLLKEQSNYRVVKNDANEEVEWNHWVTTLESVTIKHAKEALMKAPSHGIEIQPFWTVLPFQTPYRKYPVYGLGKVEKVTQKKMILIPSSVSMTEEQQTKVVQFLKDVFPPGRRG